MTRPIMVQGTASGVGKSSIAAAFCAILRAQGRRVAPFKAQNISNNSAVCEGGEIARAQAFQARACGLEPTIDMNPVLLKPSSDGRFQVILQGRPAGHVNAQQYLDLRPRLRSAIEQSLQRLRRDFDTLVIEGAGSPAEINRREWDLANMGTAELADARVILVGDIDKGGVFAHLFGTLGLLEPADRGRIAGWIINKFRGDRSVLEPGIRELERRCGHRCLGVVGYSRTGVPEEDTLEAPASTSRIHVVRFPHLANFTDFDPIDVRFIEEPGDRSPEWLVLPGSKSTVADLRFLRDRGFDRWIAGHPMKVLGICAGYQMLGRAIRDPGHVESECLEAEGLGLIDSVTTFHADKIVRRARGTHIESGEPITGYEIHMGRTEGPSSHPFFRLEGDRFEGYSDGTVFGTNLHGIFESRGFRRAFLGSNSDRPDHFDRWTRLVRESVDVESVFA